MWMIAHFISQHLHIVLHVPQPSKNRGRRL
jgi:hypothetical protein